MSRLTRRDYELIARAVRDARPLAKPETLEGIAKANVTLANQVLDHVTDNLAFELQADNPRFDRERFKAACQSRY